MMYVKTNFKNNLQALSYAVYMMVGSYFKKSTCKNAIAESKYYISYCEAGEKLQLTMEEKAEKYLINNVFASIPNLVDYCASKDAEVTFKNVPKGLVVSFICNDFKLSIMCDYKKGKCNFKHYIRTSKKLSVVAS